MSYITIISPTDLTSHLGDPTWVVLDTRFDLEGKDLGRAMYEESHIPGAVYAHLEQDLSAEPTGKNGRHPLPTIDELASVFSSWGIETGVQVVAYDGQLGGHAARIWWTLRYLGHDEVAVLDGGYASWLEQGLTTKSGIELKPAKTFIPRPRSEMRVAASRLIAQLGNEDIRIIDARAPERFRGEEEPIDPVAGHIPSAINLFWQENLDESGHLLAPNLLRARYQSILGDLAPESAWMYCGSGVTACHNILAMAHAGLEGARLYPGSWSEWISDPSRPIVRSADE